MKILIVEDEAIIAESIYQVLLQLDYKPLEPIDTHEEALQLLKHTQPQLAIVDIHIGKPFSGFKVAAVLQQQKIPFIFLTALYDKETVARAKTYNPSAYLVKPFNKENLFATIELTLAQQVHESNSLLDNDQLFIKDGTQNIVITRSEVNYLHAEGKYVELYLTTGKKYLIRNNFTEMMEQLKMDSLVQVHKSYIVNLQKIKAIKYDELLLDEVAIPIGRSYKESLKERLSLANK
jgi:two-component system, LytTR family, response regulator LytT